MRKPGEITRHPKTGLLWDASEPEPVHTFEQWRNRSMEAPDLWHWLTSHQCQVQNFRHPNNVNGWSLRMVVSGVHAWGPTLTGCIRDAMRQMGETR